MNTKEEKNKFKDFCKGYGFDLVGIASVAILNEKAPEGYRPKDILPETKVSVVLAYRWCDSIVDIIPKYRNIYTQYFLALQWRVDMMTMDVAKNLQKSGYFALPIPNGEPYDSKSLFAVASHKHTAVVAGLGEFGLGNLVLTPQFGPRQRFSQILTDAPFEPDQPLNLKICKNLLNTCQMACLKNCPVQAIPNPVKVNWDQLINEGQLIDKTACSYYQKVTLGKMKKNGDHFRCGLCFSNCPAGSEVIR